MFESLCGGTDFHVILRELKHTAIKNIKRYAVERPTKETSTTVHLTCYTFMKS